jgi:hypothetical protein
MAFKGAHQTPSSPVACPVQAVSSKRGSSRARLFQSSGQFHTLPRQNRQESSGQRGSLARGADKEDATLDARCRAQQRSLVCLEYQRDDRSVRSNRPAFHDILY